MKTSTLKSILDLKEGKGYGIVAFYHLKNSNDNQVFLKIMLDEDYSDIFQNEIDDLMELATRLSLLYEKEIHKELKEKESVIVLKLSVIAENQNNTARIQFLYNRETLKNDREAISTQLQIIEESKRLESIFTNRLAKLLDEFANAEENLQEFRFVFKKEQGKYHYWTFGYEVDPKDNRPKDEQIYQTKTAVEELLALDFEQKVLAKAKVEGYNFDAAKGEFMEITFATDKTQIYILNVNTGELME